MNIFLNIVFFLIGFFIRDILTHLYNINKKIRQAEEIIEKEKERLEFNKKYNLKLEDNDKEEK